MTWPILSLMIWFPIVSSAFVMVSHVTVARWISVATAATVLVASVLLTVTYDGSATQVLQFSEYHTWIPAFHITYHLGVDGVALACIVVSALSVLIAVLVAWGEQCERPASYFALFLLFEGLIIGLFSATDAMVFYVFFEGSLLPLFLLLGGWGKEGRASAALTFFLYNFAGALALLAALIYLYTKCGSFLLSDLSRLSLSAREQSWLFFAFFLAFAIKLPLFLVHTWLPSAHRQATHASSILIALKVGGYGLLRFNLPIVPDACYQYADCVFALSLLAIIVAGLIAVWQSDIPSLLAYSSIAQMGLVTLGLFCSIPLARDYGNSDAARLSIEGAMLQMMSNTNVSAGLFAGASFLYVRRQTHSIAAFGGVASQLPALATAIFILCLANCGLPGTSGFLGEFMVILASFQTFPPLALGAACILVIGAAYTLWFYRRVFWGEPSAGHGPSLYPLVHREKFVLAACACVVIVIGVFPRVATDLMDSSMKQLVTQLSVIKDRS